MRCPDCPGPDRTPAPDTCRTCGNTGWAHCCDGDRVTGAEVPEWRPEGNARRELTPSGHDAPRGAKSDDANG